MFSLLQAASALMMLPSLVLVMGLPLSQQERDLYMRLMQITPLLSLAVKLIVAAVFFYAAEPLSRLLVRRVEGEARPVPLTVRSALYVGTFLVAVYYALGYLPDTVQKLFADIPGQPRDAVSITANLIGIFFIAGLLAWSLSSFRSLKKEEVS